MTKTASTICPIITVDKKAATPLYKQVCDAYRSKIVDGILRAGQRVPSTRVLAAELGISRVPLLGAYSQLLAEGYFESHTGFGTIVSRSLERAPAPQATTTPSTRSNAARRISKRCPDLSGHLKFYTRVRNGGPFAAAQVAFEHFPLRIWNGLVARHCRNTGAKRIHYGDPMGLEDLRQAIAAHLRASRDVRCEPTQILIVSGSQQGLELCARVLLDPGDSAWVEDPGYSLARAALALNGCRAVPVPVDGEGLDVESGMKKSPDARAALVTPSHQYPLGVTMTAARRLRLLDWAERRKAWIIEDDYDSEYRYEGMPVSSLQGLDRNSRVVYIGTFSKVLSPSLRIGYLVVPADLTDRFLAARFATDIAPATFHQCVLADFIREGHFSRHIRKMRAIYAQRRTTLIDGIRKDLGSVAEIVGAEAGIHFSVFLNGIEDDQIAERAAEQKLWLVPLSRLYKARPKRRGFILGFGSTSVEEIPAAVRKLTLLLRR